MGTAFSYEVRALHGPTTFTATSLPSGLAIDDTGQITGIPNTEGDFNATITASSANGSSTLTYLFEIVKGARTLAWEQGLPIRSYGNTPFTLSATSPTAFSLLARAS